MTHNFKELKIWQRAMDLVTNVYTATANFPDDEKYGLTNQLRRSVVSIPSNIAEGAGRRSSAELKRYLLIAMGSLNEVQTQIELSFRLKYLDEIIKEELMDEAIQIYKMIHAFHKSLEN